MNSNITIEQMDAVISRVPNATYAQVKQALIDSNGDIIEAVIALESINPISKKTKQARQKIEDVFNKDSDDMKEFKEQFGEDFTHVKEQAKELIKRSSVIRVMVTKNDKIIVNIPLTVGVVGIALGPLVTLVGLSAAVIGKFRIKIQNEDDGTIVDLGELNEEKLNMLKQMLTNTAKDVKDVVVDNKKDDKDITDELIKEDIKNDINN
ncbi:DUF4342 domain-containing protein [[Clostridium] dakarense]|uniref:DUF4342 domain-containing protein n=1 Tax=Faecalimicrobium dakarense TaxID=1301100 RepID=UPI0004AFB52A|nr:DUF4342 domain-containing protein [[Clostridium] dakarense]